MSIVQTWLLEDKKEVGGKNHKPFDSSLQNLHSYRVTNIENNHTSTHGRIYKLQLSEHETNCPQILENIEEQINAFYNEQYKL